MQKNTIDTILQTENLIAGYGQTTILNGTTLEVQRAALTTVIGPNGAGKSTLFKALFGMLPLRQGRITLNGEDITGLKPIDLLAKGMAYVPQGRNIFPQLSVEHNLEFGGISLRNMAETHHRMQRVYEHFPILQKRAKAQAGTLSGGEQKMLEIGRAMLLDPRFLLIDEPSIGLSPLLDRTECQEGTGDLRLWHCAATRAFGIGRHSRWDFASPGDWTPLSRRCSTCSVMAYSGAYNIHPGIQLTPHTEHQYARVS